jgi:deoxyinosine 3'endonuclease (endonuclease V)
MAGAGSGILKTSKPAGRPEFGVCAAVDMHYLGTGGARAAVARAAEAVFVYVLAERTAVLPRVPPYWPGQFYLRALPPLRAVLAHLRGLGLLVVDGCTDLDLAVGPAWVHVRTPSRHRGR